MGGVGSRSVALQAALEESVVRRRILFAEGQPPKCEEIATMRPTLRRWLLGLGIIITTTSALSVFAPAPASATCYTVSVGSDGITMCP